MTTGSARASRPRVCMLGYHDSPRALPPMFNEGLSLARAGFDVEALCLGPASGPAPDETHAPGFTTRSLRARVRGFFHARQERGARPSRLVKALQYALSYGEYMAKATWRALRSGADLYQAHDLPALPAAMIAAKLRRRPIVYRAHELWSEAAPVVPFQRFWRALDRALVPWCDVVVTPEENRSRIYREEFGARRDPLTVRNCPPYRSPERSTLLREELARRGVAFSTIVLYQGLVDSMRCVEEMAEASRHLDDGIVLVVLGGGFGPWADPAARLAPYEKIVVIPRVPYERLVQYTASADVGILLYRNDCRNNLYCAPNKVFEYMMMGLPVISADHPGMKTLVEGEGVGLCVPPEDPAAIAAAVNRLAADPGERERMRGNALRLSVERYNWEVEFRVLLEAYRGLLGVVPGPGPAVAEPGGDRSA